MAIESDSPSKAAAQRIAASLVPRKTGTTARKTRPRKTQKSSVMYKPCKDQQTAIDKGKTPINSDIVFKELSKSYEKELDLIRTIQEFRKEIIQLKYENQGLRERVLELSKPDDDERNYSSDDDTIVLPSDDKPKSSTSSQISSSTFTINK